MPYRRALSDGRGGRRHHPDADPWKFAVRLACARAIIQAARSDRSLARRLGLSQNVLNSLDDTGKLWGPPEPWFQPGVPVALEAKVWVLRPKTHFLKSGQHRKGAPPWPVVPPDATNFGKEIEDAIAAWPIGKRRRSGGRPLAYRDDAQVVDSHTIKFYADGCTPGALIRIFEVESQDLGLDM